MGDDAVRVMATNPRRQQSNPLARDFWGGVWPESEPGYFAELGRMIVGYARAEAVVHCLARHFSGLPDTKARPVFGRMRLPDLIDVIRQMIRIDERPNDVYQEVDACLVQLNVIADQRHKLVHCMVEYAGSHLSVSNALTAKSLTGIESHIFSFEDLENMRIDCANIFRRLLQVVEPQPYENPELEAFVHGPWRYAPPQQGSGKKRRRGSG